MMEFNRLSKVLSRMPAKSNRANQFEWLPFWIHAIDTAEIMNHLGDFWFSDGMLERLFPELERKDFNHIIFLLGLLHDLGKITPAFLIKILPGIAEIEKNLIELTPGELKISLYPNRSKTPHTIAGEALLMNKGFSIGFSGIIGSHHGKPQSYAVDPETQLDYYEENYYGFEGKDSKEGMIWDRIQNEWIDFSLKASGFNSIQEIPNLTSAQQILLTGLLITADWLASNLSYFPYITVEEMEFDKNFIEERIETGWNKIGLTNNWNPLTFFIDEQDFFGTFEFYPNSLQKDGLEVFNAIETPGLFIIEAPMGVGKTELALGGAEILSARFGCNGLYFGLPTQATANGIFERLILWAKHESEDTVHSIRLAHGMAELNENYQDLFHGNAETGVYEQENRLIVHPWFEGKKQGLLANFVIGTVDQLLMMALKHKHVMLRHVGIMGKVVIIDECHAYDAYMNVYLDRALQWMGEYQVPVILLSATLPQKRREELVEAYQGKKIIEKIRTNNLDYPLITWTGKDTVFQKSLKYHASQKEIKIEKLEDEDIFGCIRTNMSFGGCAGVIVNTVKRAQLFANQLAETFPDMKIIVYHSGFIFPDRIEKEKRILSYVGKASTPEMRNHLIIVGTQVLEQSLDIDFDMMITDLCPMDLLLQRMGRLHRHDRIRPKLLASPKCFVLGTKEELQSGSVAVYGEWLLNKTKYHLNERINLPDDISKLVQQTYDEPVEEALNSLEMKKAWDERRYQLEDKKRRAGWYRIKKPDKGRHGLDGWLDTDQTCTEAEMAVRDIDPSVNVIALRKQVDGEVSFFPWQNNGRKMSLLHMPSSEEAREVARQRLNLPHAMCTNWEIKNVLTDLESIKEMYFSEWTQSPWLKEEYFLLFDNQNKAKLGDFCLVYSIDEGIMFSKEKGENESLWE